MAPLGFGIWKRCQSVMKKFRLNFAGLSSIEGVEEIYIFVCIIIDAKFAYFSGRVVSGIPGSYDLNPLTDEWVRAVWSGLAFLPVLGAGPAGVGR